jgi:hypothetical protein
MEQWKDVDFGCGSQSGRWESHVSIRVLMESVSQFWKSPTIVAAEDSIASTAKWGDKTVLRSCQNLIESNNIFLDKDGMEEDVLVVKNPH